MNHRLAAFFITLFLYTALFGVLVYSASIKNISDKKMESKKVAAVQMQIITPPAITKPEPIIEPIQEVVEVEPEPIIIPEPIKPKPVKKIVKKKPVEKPTPKKEVVKQTEQTPPPNPVEVTQTIIAPTKVTAPKIDIEAEQNLFLSELKKTINQNKHYPKSAVRRHTQGVVDASFCINRHGKLENVQCTGSHGMLNKAAKDSIEKSFPVKIPHNIQSQFPMDVTLELEFRLDSA